MAYKDEVLVSGPLAYWRLDEAEGTAAADATGNGNDGSYSGGVTLGASGLVSQGTAVTLDGTGQIDTPVALPAEADCALVAWVQSATAAGTIVSGGGAGVAINASGQAEATIGALTLTGAAVISDDSPHHVALSRAGNEWTLSVDGAQAATGTDSSALDSTTVSAGPSLDGRLDEVTVYERALTPREIEDQHLVGLYAPSVATYMLTGTIQADGEPAEATVRAYSWGSGEFLAEATSDPADGAYAIQGLDTDADLMVVTKPAAGLRPLAHGPVTPTVQ